MFPLIAQEANIKNVVYVYPEKVIQKMGARSLISYIGYMDKC